MARCGEVRPDRRRWASVRCPMSHLERRAAGAAVALGLGMVGLACRPLADAGVRLRCRGGHRWLAGVGSSSRSRAKRSAAPGAWKLCEVRRRKVRAGAGADFPRRHRLDIPDGAAGTDPEGAGAIPHRRIEVKQSARRWRAGISLGPEYPIGRRNPGSGRSRTAQTRLPARDRTVAAFCARLLIRVPFGSPAYTRRPRWRMPAPRELGPTQRQNISI